MYDEAILACLSRIENRLNSDEYEAGGIWTVGGPAGTYTLHTPYNTECEWSIFDINSTPSGSNLVGEVTRTVLNVGSAAQATYTSADLPVGDLTELACMFNVTALTGGTTPTVTFQINTKGSDGIYYQIDKATAINAPGQIYRAVGSGNNIPMGASDPGSPFGDTVQVVMVTTGAPTSITFSASIKGKGPVVAAPGNGVVAISAGDPTTVPINPTLGSTSNTDSNAYNGFLAPIIFGQSHDVGGNYWQPLGRGANLYITVNPVSGLVYVCIAFRRKLDRAIPAPPRRQAHTHSHVESRRGTRTFAAGFEAQYPGVSYQHEEIPESQDTANIGNVENITPAQALLAKMRNGGR